MAFVYDKERDVAVDPDRNIEIGYAGGFLDTDNIFMFYYKSELLHFKYEVMVNETRRDVERQGIKKTEPVTLSYWVLEYSVRGNLSRCKNYVPDDYPQIIEDIKDGLFLLGTRGGETLVAVPEFKVEFFNSARDVQ